MNLSHVQPGDYLRNRGGGGGERGGGGSVVGREGVEDENWGQGQEKF